MRCVYKACEDDPCARPVLDVQNLRGPATQRHLDISNLTRRLWVYALLCAPPAVPLLRAGRHCGIRWPGEGPAAIDLHIRSPETLLKGGAGSCKHVHVVLSLSAAQLAGVGQLAHGHVHFVVTRLRASRTGSIRISFSVRF